MDHTDCSSRRIGKASIVGSVFASRGRVRTAVRVEVLEREAHARSQVLSADCAESVELHIMCTRFLHFDDGSARLQSGQSMLFGSRARVRATSETTLSARPGAGHTWVP